MALKTLHIATTGLLAGATLAIATEGLLQPQVEAVSKPSAPSSYDERIFKPVRQPRIIHALKYELDSVAELIISASSRYEVETQEVLEVSYNSTADIYFNAESYATGKNVRVTVLESEAEVVLDLKSNISFTANIIREYTEASDSNLNFELSSNYNIATEESSYANVNSEGELSIEAVSTVNTYSVDVDDDEIERVIAAVMVYLYG